MENHSCPDCPREFDSKNGLSTHHSIKHEGPLPTQNKFCCEICESDFYVPDSVAERNPKYCSDECRMTALHNRNSGKNHHAWQEDRDKECEVCGEKFRLANKNGRFCSNSCKAEWMKVEFSGEKNPNYNDSKLEKICVNCGENFLTYESVDKSFCSINCRSDYYSGEQHPSWKEGYKDWYGSNWKNKRQEVLSRDCFECQDCGVSPEEVSELVVHHIKPIRLFEKDEIENKANRKNNLITLCRSCHPKWEKVSRKAFGD